MKTMRYLKRESDRYTSVIIAGEKYRGYMIGDLPSKFGCLEYGESSGVSEWYKTEGSGLTYLAETNFPKGQ